MVLRGGYRCATYAKNKHHNETKANWTSVRVTGFGKALRIDFEDVFVSAELRYQTKHSV